MALISIEEAASRTGVGRSTIEDWAGRGLLALHVRPRPSAQADSAAQAEQWVEEEELERLVESLGWLHLSSPGWDGPEGA